MAHSKVYRRSLTLVFLLSFLLLFSLLSISTNVKGDDNNQIVHQISIDGDDDAYKTWDDWSNYFYNDTSWWPGDQSEMNHTQVKEYTPDGTLILLFNSYMYHGAEGGGWERLSPEGTTFTIRNVMKYAVGVTLFRDSSVNIENCKEVVLGMDFHHPYDGIGWVKGYLGNTQVVVSNFEKLWIYNFSYSKSDGEPLEIDGNGNSTVVIHSLYIHPSVMVKSEGVGIRNVGKLVFNSSKPIRITNHTPDMTIENVKNIELDQSVILDNRYYSVSDNKWEKSGIGILTKNVKEIGGDSAIFIRNCDTGIAFEDNGEGEAFNQSSYVYFVNCTQKYSYGYTYSSLPMGMGDLIGGFQALTGFLVAIAWIRIAIFSTSEKKEKKELAKDMLWKGVIGTIIVAIVVYGYPIMVSIVNYVFGG